MTRAIEMWRTLPRAVRLILANYAAGAAAGIAFAALLVATNTQGLRDLLRDTANPWVAIILLTLQMALTFAALSAAVAVMRLVARR
jgi:hypothetical protein